MSIVPGAETRFAVMTYMTASAFINASADPETGRPGSWAQVLGIDEERLDVLDVTALPSGSDPETFPEAFRLLITYRLWPAPDPPRHLLRELYSGMPVPDVDPNDLNRPLTRW